MRLNAVTWVGQTALLAAAALTFAIASIAVLPATPAGAQSDDEATGRIVARLLDDGRIEFGWQPASGARVLPRARYFPADATVDRWLNSSPVEVDGAEIGRINARLLSDGRIEFAFTPTDGERIAPQARYFPANARVGRWLRSTEIAISPPAPAGFTAASAADHTCAIRANGAITCWGPDYSGETDAPEGSYTAVSAGGIFTCAIRENTDAIECWGANYSGEFSAYSAPEGSYTAISTGSNHACAVRDSGEIECWGSNETYAGHDEWVYAGQATPPPGSFTAVSTRHDHTCGLRESGAIVCWGRNKYGQTDAPEGSYTAVSAGSNFTCAIRDTGAITCWGANGLPYNHGEERLLETGQIDALEGNYIAVSAGGYHTCAIRENKTIACWGYDGFGQSTPPPGSYTAVSAGDTHTCAIRDTGSITCWGDNRQGQTDNVPPS